MSITRLTSLLACLVVALVAAGCTAGDHDGTQTTGGNGNAAPTAAGDSGEPAPEDDADVPNGPEPLRAQGEPQVQTIATGLEVPWDLAFLPDRSAVITERGGTVRLMSAAREVGEPIGRVDVTAVGEGGLMGVAVDPDYPRQPWVYFFRTANGGNQIVRFRLEASELSDEQVLVERIPSDTIHNGGRLRFGPDDHLYFATGDAAETGRAQDEESLAGKFLRLAPRQYRGTGGEPEVVSLGHRNPQGFDWEPGTGRLVASEHGPVGDDEINVIEQTQNYGWPEHQGPEHGEGFVDPLTTYAPAIAPSGSTFVRHKGSTWTGDMLIACLRGQQIRRVRLDGRKVTVDESLFEGRWGRLRVVVEAPDGSLYVLTNNRDGRGTPVSSDDRVLRIVPPAA